jgi:hypothetical protein
MCTVLLPPGGNPIVVNKYISYHVMSYHIIIIYHIMYHIMYHIIYIISYHIMYHITYHMYHIMYHIIYHIISYHTISYIIRIQT